MGLLYLGNNFCGSPHVVTIDKSPVQPTLILHKVCDRKIISQDVAHSRSKKQGTYYKF